MTPSKSSGLAQWISSNFVIAAGGFMSGIFLLVGILGSLAFMPRVMAWGIWKASRTVK